MLGRERVICFTPEQEYFAKGTHGITGQIPVPELSAGVKNDFITRLFDTARKNIQAENDVFTPQKKKYEDAMAKVAEILSGVTNLDELNAAYASIGALDHALTSKKEAGVKLNAKAKELGCVFDKAAQAYKVKENA